MITRPTVLVLGAGVSKYYKFPLGRELFITIRDYTVPDSAHKKEYFTALGSSREIVKDFHEKINDSQLNSIDRLMRRLSKRKDFLEIGKRAIAKILVGSENAQELKLDKKGERIYELLWRNMSGDDPTDFAKNQLTIITFNYDRSLEYALYYAMKSNYDLDERSAAEALKSLEIIHVYGQLGLPHYCGILDSTLVKRCQKYENSVERRDIEVCATEIKVVTTDREADSEELRTARARLKAAELIVFLGFDYDPGSIALLGKDLSFGGKETRILGTAFGKTHREIRKIRANVGMYNPEGLNNPSNELTFQDSDALEFLRNHVLPDN